MTFTEYCQLQMNMGIFNINLSEDEFTRICRRCFHSGGLYSNDIEVEWGFGKSNFTFIQKIDGQKVTMFKGSWSELYHLLREQYGKEDKQLTLW